MHFVFMRKFYIAHPRFNFQFHNQEPDKPEELLEILKFVRPGKGFTPKMDFSTKVDVNGKDESPIFSFLKVCEYDREIHAFFCKHQLYKHRQSEIWSIC